ncbi:MAG TPA: O-antigen ligase family protein [Acetobacteraceae bacterium]|nr:O-antigen ligase family protein [Acetobacteraceae bacterium]
MRDLALRQSAAVALAMFLGAAAICAGLFPAAFWVLMTGGLAAGALLVVWRRLELVSACWFVLAACTPEMALHDWIGPEAFQPTIAAVKGTGLLLALFCAMRFGPAADPFNPGFAFAAMFVAGLAHGLFPGLTVADSLRSLVGSAAPYAFAFARPGPRWCAGIIRAAKIAPLVAVAAGAALDVAGLRPLFIDSGGLRLAATGHPAFLAGAALTAIYACLIEYYRQGRDRDLALLAANFAVLLLTGARAPLLYGALVVGSTLAFVPSAAVSPSARRLVLLAGAAAIPVFLAAAASLESLRVFNLLLNDDAGDLSGRAALWPYFARAAQSSPWFGWGVGAGNLVVPPRSEVIQLMHTWAAHNEWLRMEVEGGQIGRALLVLWFALWAWRHTRRLQFAERVIMRLVFVAFACHAWTDNVLISTSASVLFTFCIAVFARGAAGSRAPESG